MANTIMTSHQLAERIESLRNRMIKVATVKGFTSEESLAISRELDYLLNKYDLQQREQKLHKL
ncbi:Spo0E family sporulation regulatory protein-aspartic acid phosphatase [Pontibacillus salicampi]|uniref:Spo0E family sporulation regulatory protein-aspartic acid phosphatase n=1 Tax=Pontibacillus salicampi TaxID=1449801 RepID=UPI00366DFD08